MVVFCLIVSLFHCSFVPLFQCFIVSLFHCFIIARPQPEEGPGANWGAAPAGFGTQAPTKGGEDSNGEASVGDVSHWRCFPFWFGKIHITVKVHY